jgi:hypothetical protein
VFSFHYLNDAPIVSVQEHPELDGNINGPSLIRAPEWLDNPPGKYLLYFAHHEGRSIRLAFSDHLTGPWRTVTPGPLELEHSMFASSPPDESQLHAEARPTSPLPMSGLITRPGKFGFIIMAVLKMAANGHGWPCHGMRSILPFEWK